MIDIYPLVYIEWQDAEHDGGWGDVRDEARHVTTVCASVGWVVHKNKFRLVLAASLNPLANEVGNKQYIPVKMVTRYRVIKKGRKRG